jgi:antitoxin YobK
MSMADYERARAIIDANKDKGTFAGPRPEDLVKKAESALGIRFPDAYRQFLLDYGAGNFGSAEFYGVIDDDWEESSVPDGVWYTLNERVESGMPNELVVVGDTGTGDLYVLDLSDGDGPVCIVDPGTAMTARERVAPDFGTFLLDRVQQILVKP